MKLFLDDRRDPPDNSWILVRTYEEAINLVQILDIDEMSLDYDLGLWKKNGVNFLEWLAQRKLDGYKVTTNIKVHSTHPTGETQMNEFIEQVLKQ